MANRAEENREKDRQGYDAQITNQSELLDKSILFIATATFNIALVFTDKLIPLQQAYYILIFIFSLSCLALSIIITLFSFKFSVCDASSMIQKIDQDYSKKNSKIENPCTFMGKCVEPMNWFSLIFLTLGFTSMIVFIAINLYSIKGVSHG